MPLTRTRAGVGGGSGLPLASNALDPDAAGVGGGNGLPLTARMAGVGGGKGFPLNANKLRLASAGVGGGNGLPLSRASETGASRLLGVGWNKVLTGSRIERTKTKHVRRTVIL